MAKKNQEGATVSKTRGGRKSRTNYSISLAEQRPVIDQLAELYSVSPAEIVAGLGRLYAQNSFAPHFSRLQGEYSSARQEAEEQALARIHQAVNGGDPDAVNDPAVEEVPDGQE